MNTEDALPASPPATTAPAPASRWSRILGGVVAVLALARLGVWGLQMLHPSMPQCDSSTVRDTLNDIYKQRAQLDVKAMDAVQTLAHSDSTASCSAHVTLSNDEKNTIVYGLSRDGRSIQVRIEKATEG